MDMIKLIHIVTMITYNYAVAGRYVAVSGFLLVRRRSRIPFRSPRRSDPFSSESLYNEMIDK